MMTVEYRDDWTRAEDVTSIDPPELCARLKRWLPRKIADAADFEVTFEGAAQGGSSDTTFIRVCWVGPKGTTRRDLVLRRQPASFQVYPDPELDRQVRVLEVLGRNGTVPVPAVTWFEPDPAVIGSPFFLMTRIPGRTLCTFPSYNESGWLAEATPSERERMWRSSVQTLARIHRLPSSEFAFLSRAVDGDSGLEQQLSYWSRYIRTMFVTSPHPLLSEAERWLAGNMPSPPPTSLSWGDARLGNMIFREFECVAVLDWETVSLGGAEEDLGWWLFYDDFFSAGLGLHRLEGLGGREETLRLWEKETGRAPQHMHYYDVLAAYRVALTIEKVSRLHAKQGVRLPVGCGDENPATVQVARLLSLPVRCGQ
jgi:aminoglycoside phosphotransferase (APT) family kinase protein